MRSLFAKILAWFALTVVVTIAASILVSALTYHPNAEGQAPFSMLVTLESRDARRAWESGGAGELRAALDRFRQITHASQLLFTDANGVDLLTGEPHADLISAARNRSSFPLLGSNGTTYARFSADGKYCFFLTFAPFRLLIDNLQPAHVIVLAIAVVLCYGLAHRLTKPLRGLRDAFDRFGRGELDARAGDHRGDELGDLAHSFNRMADRIQTLLAAERRLLLDISHELRSPLARLSLAVELARSGQTSAQPLDRIQREADRLNVLIGQLLDVTRGEGDPKHRKLERVNLDELVQHLVDDCTIEARIRGCSLELVPPPRVAMEGDIELLRRAVENVVRNAIRYAPRESKIEIALENGSGRAKVRIRDYGPGVPVDALPHIFDAFYRVQPDRNRGGGGVGLGLSIARRAVELHKGTLTAWNATPGLMVEIELPV